MRLDQNATRTFLLYIYCQCLESYGRRYCSVRPYYHDVPGRDKYWAAYVSIVKSVGGRPHWAKVCITVIAVLSFAVVSFELYVKIH